MSEPIDHAMQGTWQSQTGAPGPRQAGALMEQHLREQRRRTRRFLASAAIIVPSWIGMFWMMPDLRPLAAFGLAVSSVLVWRMLRGARPARHETTELPCAAHEIRVLSRERDFYRSMPRWVFAPLTLMQLVIIATLLTNPRFEKNAFFAGSLSFFVCTVIVVLGIAFRRSRQMLDEIERELSVLAKAVEA
jgi:hypothetical protein